MGLAEMGELDPVKRGAGDISFVAADVDGLAGLGPASRGDHAPGRNGRHRQHRAPGQARRDPDEPAQRGAALALNRRRDNSPDNRIAVAALALVVAAATAVVAIDAAIDITLAIAVLAIAIDDPLAHHAIVGRAVRAGVRRLAIRRAALAVIAAAANRASLIRMSLSFEMIHVNRPIDAELAMNETINRRGGALLVANKRQLVRSGDQRLVNYELGWPRGAAGNRACPALTPAARRIA